MPSAKLSSRVSLLAALGLLATAAGAACSANSGSLFSSSGVGAGNTGSTEGVGAGMSTGNGNGSNNGGSGGFVLSGTGPGSGAGSGTGGMANCAGETHQAMTLPLDMYIMEDQSGSMNDMISNGGTKWQAVTGALTAFVQQQGLTGISVGIQYFDLSPTGSMSCSCNTTADCTIPGDFCLGGICFECELGSGGGQDSCNASDYAKPDVEIAPLPGVAQAIVTSLGNHSPSTNTATAPALQGALDHAKDWATQHPGHVVIAVLATDGEPNTCSPTDQAGLAAISAAALAGTPSIQTFAIGVFAQADIPSGPDLLDAIAQSGGTGQAFNINTTQNVNQQFLMALNQIRGSALGCQYQIPAPMSGSNADPSKVNVQYTPGGSSTPEIIPQVPNMGACPSSGLAWYYDNPNAPTQILLCPGTCSVVQADANGKIEVLLGCKTVTAT